VQVIHLVENKQLKFERILAELDKVFNKKRPKAQEVRGEDAVNF
jgi:hypothetical protein